MLCDEPDCYAREKEEILTYLDGSFVQLSAAVDAIGNTNLAQIFSHFAVGGCSDQPAGIGGGGVDSRLRSLRPNGRIPSDEWGRPARQPS